MACVQAFVGDGDAPLELEHLLGTSPPSGGRRAAGAGAAGGSGGGGANRVFKAKSAWLAERERLMAEWGEWSISGLVLASD